MRKLWRLSYGNVVAGVWVNPNHKIIEAPPVLGKYTGWDLYDLVDNLKRKHGKLELEEIDE